MDAALQSSDVGVMMDIDSSTNITDLLAHMKDLDGDLIEEVMAKHESGVMVLLGPAHLERAELIRDEHFAKILTVLRNHADYILIDTPTTIDMVSMVALDAADQIVLVSTPEVTALRNTARFIQLSAKLGYPADKIFLLLNRTGSKGAVRLDDIREHLKHPIGMQIRSAGKEMVPAANKGVPVEMTFKRFGVGKSFRQLATVLDTGEREAKRRQRATRASWLKGRSSADGKADSVPTQQPTV